MKSSVVIGDGNVIRDYCTINRGTGDGTQTRVGNNCFLMTGSHLGHNCSVGDNVIIANNVLLGGHVHIADRAFLGGAGIFHQFVRVGTMAITQGGSAFSKDVPPYLVGAGVNSVVGLNSIGLRRAGLSGEERKEAKESYRLLYRSGLNTTQALAQARQQTWGRIGSHFFEFVEAAKKRGICDLMDRSAAKTADEE
jgi:UDP-N-acetylglucosamine acyltransferase